MEAQEFSEGEKALLRKIESLSGASLYVIVLAGFPGAGKTFLARRLTSYYRDCSLHVSEDDFLSVPSAIRKSYLEDALRSGDTNRLALLAKPSDPSLNPYADPVTWYDWTSLSECLFSLKTKGHYKRSGGWDQKTGMCDREVVYSVARESPSFCFIDANYPLLYKKQIDWLVFLEVPLAITKARQVARDGHRSDYAYLGYKQMLDDIYTKPNMIRTQTQADQILYP